MALKRQAVGFPDLRFEDERLNRLMQFLRAQAAEIQRLQQMLRAGTAGQVLEKATTTDYDAGWKDFVGGTITAGENVGGGAQVYQAVSGTLLAFRTLLEGDNVTIVQTDDAITISATIVGGTGTVTSVEIASNDLAVTGGPITTDGVIELEIKDGAVTYAKMQSASADGVVIGRRAGDGAGVLEELSGTDLAAIVGGSGYPRQLGYAGIV